MSSKTKNWTTAVILSGLLGGIGADRFYLGCIETGILKLLTFGGLGIWAIIDFIRLLTGDKLCGNFKWDTSTRSQSGGGNRVTDCIYISISLLMATVVCYYYVYPWIKDKFNNNQEIDNIKNKINNIANHIKQVKIQ